MIPVLQPSCSDAEILAVEEVLHSNWWGNGPVCREFERVLAQRYGYAYCVTVNSATAALHLALLSHGIGPGDEVIVPALTFISTALAVVYCGAKPVFADVRPDTLTLDYQNVCRKFTLATKAIIPVDYAGYPAKTWNVDLGVPIIQDAAHSCGGKGYGDSVCLSFHPVKNCGSPDGGAILLNNAERAERLRALRWCGIDRSTWERSGKRYSWDYEIKEIGYKCHWNDVSAAIGLQQLHRLTKTNERRRVIAECYFDNLHGNGVIKCPSFHDQHTWHLYPIRVPATQRDNLIDYLAERNIGTSVHYKPLTMYKPFADQETLPITEAEWRRLVSLPIYPDLTDQQQSKVIAAVKEFFLARS